MMKRFILLVTVVLIVAIVFAQDEKRNFKIVSYNVENYFDTEDNPDTNDEEFLPGGMRGWNNVKYAQKQSNIAKTLVAIGGWEAPAVVGLCEIESEKAMRDLTRYSTLKNLDYKYIHHESPDARGIDVALMYQPHRFKPFYDEAIPIKAFKTRDILYVAGTIAATNDTLHLFVCHFPSRLGGELESEERRVTVASRLREKVDSIFHATSTANIVIMGDFNDHPSNSSILNTLDANPLNEGFENDKLYNLAFLPQEQGKGTHKHQGEWGMLDQMIVSGNLLNATSGVSTTVNDFHVFEADFLLEDDKAFLGKMPKRTYIGMKFNGGFSDHLPIVLDLWY